MHNFPATLRTASGVATVIAVVVALGGVVVISSLIGRVDKLESEIKSLRSELDHPRVRPLASILDAGAGLRR